ncbi:Glycogen debranching enzyme [Planctomycetes bacterium Pan216]|uniref:Glycogen debranching enzyme n=1 Tax=Kolteria novifilia TaxID=2527975 RepID=A0A518B624_9BACT|nr:Glycogen debranching enzyme [Planctomycetes bacterium Pan216]
MKRRSSSEGENAISETSDETEPLSFGPPPSVIGGAIPHGGGTQFTLFSRHADAVTLLLFDKPDAGPTRELRLNTQRNKRGDLWSIFVPGVGVGQLYAYRVAGPNEPEHGHRFHKQRVLLDPWAKALTSNAIHKSRRRSAISGSSAERPKCVVVGDHFDWQGTEPPNIPLADSIIYEVHVRGLTKHDSSNSQAAGTYLGLIDKIPYFLDLGITAVELLPIHEFDHLEHARKNPVDGSWLTNYWGYSTVGFFAPNGRYAKSRLPGAQVDEFKTMVREMHRAGLEIILDVVYNHTAEGNHLGPTINFKGIDNAIYYHLADDRRYYKDYSGCGNSLNANHPVVRRMIVESLRYWVTHCHVDGFRFDLASVLSRDRSGALVSNPPLLEDIEHDPILRDTKIIAEAWDAAGAYQVGHFPGKRWAEWNGRYRDDIRQYWRGDPGKTGGLATRLTGSSDLYQASGRKPFHSVNFITSHDGFTMNDLVSYNHKHNLANGEDGRDGDNHNSSYNHGDEGSTKSRRVEKLRIRQIKNFLATLLLSQGTPMMLGGDEFRRTQGGNNNAYCQDNEISWLDWSLLEKHEDVHRFVRALIWFRRRHPVLRRREFFTGKKFPGREVADINWYDADAKHRNWDRDHHTLMCLIDGQPSHGEQEPPDDDILMLFNSSIVACLFTLTAGGDKSRPWRLLFDTGNTYPRDLFPEDQGPLIAPGRRYPVIARSMACFYRPKADAES